MTREVSVVLVGIGGYGNLYVEALLDKGKERSVKIAGVVDPKPENCNYFDQLRALGIPFFKSIDQFYAESGADLAVITTPIHLHMAHVCLALENGSNVLCEKPVAPTVQEAKKIIETRDKAKRFVSVGYQWSHSAAIQELKKDIMAGVFGKAKKLKTIILWPRNDAYYQRSYWAGRIKDHNGNWILDSVASNATAHYIHNMFYVLGSKTDKSAVPVEVSAELYRANPIENYDTAAIRAYTEDGAELLYISSHAVKDTVHPVFHYQFENADIVFGNPDREELNSSIVAVFNDGTKKDYGNPFKDEVRKLWIAADAVRGEAELPCGVEAALSHVICVNAAQESMDPIVEFPSSIVKRLEENRLTWVEGLSDILIECYAAGKMPFELGVDWAKPGKKIDTREYSCFRGINNIK
ncbi:MAG TPA: Gfo/Idh/MocA family oxidoreductase [Clostridiales bacterium]|nr:Gfo/Idh/MocA family oxidoreductase [Clostridiales bacterium]